MIPNPVQVGDVFTNPVATFLILAVEPSLVWYCRGEIQGSIYENTWKDRNYWFTMSYALLE